MSELKPCPLCNGNAEHAENDDGDWAVCCLTRGCLLATWAVSEAIWRALPRQSATAKELAAELREAADALVEGDWTCRMSDLLDWADRLEGALPCQTADAKELAAEMQAALVSDANLGTVARMRGMRPQLVTYSELRNWIFRLSQLARKDDDHE